jgi:hypothetical protein
MWQRRGRFYDHSSVTMRLLLCRPEGGLNDILSEIGKCMAYCKKFDRILIVEADYSDAHHFKDRFSNYFTADDQRFRLNSDNFGGHFDTLSTLPHFVQNRVTHYQRELLRTEIPADDKGGVTFDFSKDHSQQLLVHHQNGQQKKRNAIIALSNLQLNDHLASQLEKRLLLMGQGYVGFHVRHTDYKTAYEKHVTRLAPSIRGPVFLATDNRAVVDFFKNLFGEKRVFSFGALPEEAGEPSHYGADAGVLKARNADAILDLFTLALANDYYFFPRIKGGFRLLPVYSGFSVLAARLRATPAILRHVLPSELHDHIPSDRGPKTWRWRYF